MDATSSSNHNADKRESEASGSLEMQVSALRAEIASLSKSLTERLGDAKGIATDMAANAAGQARDVRDVAAVYPLAMSSSAVVGMLIGVVVGLLLGRSTESRHWYDRFGG